jgi:murein DD-endopeptidase MepM/ murein hydrolase activator NlpD
LTASFNVLNNRFVRKAPILTAAAAALFVLLFPAPSEARSKHHRRPSRRALSHAPKDTEAARPASVVHQIEDGGVVLDSIDVEIAGAVEMAPVAEMQDYPQLPCPAEDPVIEAHVHVVDADAPEKPDSEILERQESTRIARIARRLSSLFRPKSATARVRPRDVDLSELVAENFLIPVEGVDRQRLRDSFLESRGQYARHLAIDIGAPRGTPILATADGEIVKLTREGRGGITIYQKDATGRYLFFYCHLSRYAPGLRVGRPVEKGDVIGYVGATGHVIGGPHLHFSITRLPEDDNLREGLAINPYLIFLAGVP